MNQKMLPRPRFWAEAAERLRPRTLLGETLTLFVLYFIAAFGQGAVVAIPMTAWLATAGRVELSAVLNGEQSMEALVAQLLNKMPDWLMLVSLFAYGMLGVAALVYCRKFQRRSLASMGLRGPKPLAEYGLGWALGLVLFLGVTAIGIAAGGYAVPEDGLYTGRLGLLLLALLGCGVQGAAMELMLRGYYAPAVGGRYPVLIAVVSVTLVSGMFQSGGMSMGWINALLLGAVLCVWTIKRGNLWSACGAHGAWLFAQNFLLDFSGGSAPIRLLSVKMAPYRSLLTGGAYGPQASLCATIVLLAALAGVLALKAKDPAPEPPPAPQDQASNFL